MPTVGHHTRFRVYIFRNILYVWACLASSFSRLFSHHLRLTAQLSAFTRSAIPILPFAGLKTVYGMICLLAVRFESEFSNL